MVGEMLDRVRSDTPLVHHITNWVTIYHCAAITRAFGALPVMAHAGEETAAMAGIASSLVLNIGTLTPELVDAMITAAKTANQRGIPVVLDAVGAGATSLRNKESARILDTVRVDIIKGNVSEIACLAGLEAFTRGVEAQAVKGDSTGAARALAAARSCVVVITGAEDMVTDGTRTFTIKNGHALMGAVVGTGCMASSVLGAFAAVGKDTARAAATALACYGVAGELASQDAKGPGSFLERIFDEVYALDAETVERMAKVEEC